jgi:hypothetical protein
VRAKKGSAGAPFLGCSHASCNHFLNTFFRTFRPSFCRSGLNSFNKLFCSWPSMPNVKSSKKPEADRDRWCQAGATRAPLVMEPQGSAGWSPDGKWLVTGGNDGTGPGLFRIPVEGGPPARLTKGAAENPVWSPDGRLIVYTGTIIGVFSPMHATRPDGTSVEVPKITVANRGERYRFLPDGKSLVYMQGETQSQDFWSLDFATK